MTADLATEHLNEAGAGRIPDAPARALQDRRRPGRLQHVSPALIGLLRFRADAEVLQNEDGEAENARRTAQGMLFGTVLGLLSWVGLFRLIEHLLG
jgi:hypothetical protein